MLSQTDTTSNKFQVIELFAGAGGLAQGISNAGRFTVAALYDNFEPARDSYSAFDPSALYKIRDIGTISGADIRDDLDGRPLHGIIGGPPCQGFSIAGKQAKDHKFNYLVPAYARIVQELEPQFLVMENVPQLVHHPLFQPLLDTLGAKYNVSYTVLNAAQYGAPQTRHRLFVIAYHRGLNIVPTFPKPTHGRLGQQLYAYHLQDSSERIKLTPKTSKAILGADPVSRRSLNAQECIGDAIITKQLKRLVTVGVAISDVAVTSDRERGLAEYVFDAKSEYQTRARNGSHEVANCVARRHVGRPLEIAMSLREGGIPGAECGATGKRYYSQAYGRLHREGLARTLTTYFQNAGSGRFLHYEQPRTLTIREAARLQGFPDHFEFIGTLAEQMQLVGNAVPLPLAEAIGKHVAKELSGLIKSA